MTVEPGRAGSATLSDFNAPVGEGELLVEGVMLGICGTDREIADGLYGQAPPGHRLLVIGHESLGRVVEAPPGGPFSAGDLVAGIVRRPDPEPCEACAAGCWDMCLNGLYTERGIKALDGFGAEHWRIEPDFAVPVPDGLAEVGVLVEPTSVVAKAWAHVDAIATRSAFERRRVLVTGAGPVGLLAALLGVQRGLEVHVLDRVDAGPKPALVRRLGAEYHSGGLDDVPEPDIVIECTGAAALVMGVMERSSSAGIVCLTGVSSGGRTIEVDVGAANRQIVLENDVVFGSVNANRSHYQAAVGALEAADHGWLTSLITRHVPLSSWVDGLEGGEDDVKVVVDLS
jgi:threonine dehydrogenase-like Zn-dependent dehydrogenase